MTLITDLEALTAETPAERVRELNERCLLELGWKKTLVGNFMGQLHLWSNNSPARSTPPQLLTNAQDAIDALPEGWRWYVKKTIYGRPKQVTYDVEILTGHKVVHELDRHNPATALTIANLRSRA